MKRIIKFIVDKNNERQKIKRLMDAKRNYLQKGTYRIIGAGKRIVFIESAQALSFIEKNRVHMSRKSTEIKATLAQRLKKFLAKFATIRLKDGATGNDAGTLIMFTRSEDMKIFNFTNNRVTTFLENKSDYDAIKKSYNHFNKSFLMTMISYNDNEQSYTEAYLDFTPYQEWSPTEVIKGIENIFDNYNHYLSRQAKKTFQSVSSSFLLKQFQDKVYNKELVQIIEQIYSQYGNYDDVHWPVVQLHGDLNFNNILLANGQYYFIDWEDTGEYLFFYDLLNWLFVEAAYSNDFAYLKSYFNGEYDAYLSHVFSLFDLEYNVKYRKFYLANYICSRIVQFEINVHKDLIETIYKYYLKVLQSI